MAKSEVSQQWDLSLIRYSKVWEDHRTLSSALEVTKDDIIISITRYIYIIVVLCKYGRQLNYAFLARSAGDNTLNLLLENPKKIVAVDLSPAQNAILELKIAAIKNLTYEDYLLVLGELDDTENRR